MYKAKLLYKNNRVVRIYLAAIFTFATVTFAYFMVITQFDSLKKEFTSTTNLIAFLVFIFLCTHILLGTMLWMHQRYVLKIIEVDKHIIEIKTWSIIGLHGNKQYPKEILNETEFNPGKGFYGRGPVVNAPWLKVKTPKGRTLVVDLQGEFYDNNFFS